VKALQKNWLDVLKQMDTITLMQYVLSIWYSLLFLSNKYTIHLLTTVCFLQHCYKFQCLHILLRQFVFAKVTN